MKQIFSQCFQRNQPCQHLDFKLLVSGTVRQYISVVLTIQAYVCCYSSPRNLIQPQCTANLFGPELNVFFLSICTSGLHLLNKSNLSLPRATFA